MAPGRWPMTMASDWNRARRHGEVTEVEVGPRGHTGRGGYVDHKLALPDGTDKTVSVISEIVQRHQQQPLQNAAQKESVEQMALPAVHNNSLRKVSP